MSAVCVFCGSSDGVRPVYLAAAAALGRSLALGGHTLVYGGAQVGLMGAVADAALAHGGRVIGVIPQVLIEMEVAHACLTELRSVATMHERKALMADLADIFIALPGGMGTLEELAEILTWAQLGLHRKPLGLLDTAGYWRDLLAFLDHAQAEGFLRAEHRRLPLVEADGDGLLARLLAATRREAAEPAGP